MKRILGTVKLPENHYQPATVYETYLDSVLVPQETILYSDIIKNLTKDTVNKVCGKYTSGWGLYIGHYVNLHDQTIHLTFTCVGISYWIAIPLWEFSRYVQFTGDAFLAGPVKANKSMNNQPTILRQVRYHQIAENHILDTRHDFLWAAVMCSYPEIEGQDVSKVGWVSCMVINGLHLAPRFGLDNIEDSVSLEAFELAQLQSFKWYDATHP